jgi:hypothetical protein
MRKRARADLRGGAISDGRPYRDSWLETLVLTGFGEVSVPHGYADSGPAVAHSESIKVTGLSSAQTWPRAAGV